MTFPMGRGDCRVAVESTYNGSTTLTAADALYFETVTAKVDDNVATREGQSPYGPGHKAYTTSTTGEFAGQVLLETFTLGGANKPDIDPLLQMVGFDAGTYSGAGPAYALKYILLAHGHKSAKMEQREFDVSNALNTLTTMTGLRGQGTIKLVGKGAATLDFAAKASVSTKVNEASGPSVLTLANTQPAVGGAGKVTLTRLTGGAAFAGILYDVEFTLYPTQESEGLASRVISIRPGGKAVGIKLSMDQQALGTFDMHALRAAGTGLTLHIELPLAGSGVNNIEIDSTIQLVKVGDADGPAGNKIWSVEAIAIFPQVSSDGGGVVPIADVFSMTYRTT